MLERIAEWDRRVISRVYNWHHPLITRFFQGVSSMGSTVFWGAIGLLCYIPAEFWNWNPLAFPTYQALAQVLILFCHNLLTAFLVSGLVMLPLKYVVYRPRPFQKYADISSRDFYVKDPSFPSGHCAQWVFYGWVASTFLLGQWYLILTVAILPLIMLSRMHLGCHFLSDTIAGAALGVVLIPLIALCLSAFNTWYTWFFHLIFKGG